MQHKAKWTSRLRLQLVILASGWQVVTGGRWYQTPVATRDIAVVVWRNIFRWCFKRWRLLRCDWTNLSPFRPRTVTFHSQSSELVTAPWTPVGVRGRGLVLFLVPATLTGLKIPNLDSIFQSKLTRLGAFQKQYDDEMNRSFPASFKLTHLPSRPEKH